MYELTAALGLMLNSSPPVVLISKLPACEDPPESLPALTELIVKELFVMRSKVVEAAEPFESSRLLSSEFELVIATSPDDELFAFGT